MPRVASFIAFMVACSGAAFAPAHASEGALGRPITGVQGTNFAGVVPATPGFNLSVQYIYYGASIGAEREVPIGGTSALGIDLTAQLLAFSGVYVWPTGEGKWNYATAVAVPFADMDASADVRIGRFGASTNDRDSGLFDATFVPVIASRHFSQTRHMSLALYVSAPTGSYDPDRLANLSLNTWIYSPTVGYTQLFSKGEVEFSTLAAVDFYTKNDATDYQNGAVFRVDALLMRRYPNGWGLGAAGGWIEQVEDDTGPTADRLNGFRGHSLGIGPLATYAKKWEGGQVEFSARWLYEFDVKNRFQGHPIMVTATIQF
ncbi:hypothetical protein LYSHEL_22280 [Lysobacter helvus]|uniref:Phenol degradation protein meta n=2 Tax=Lysobacteraceae TaxID=32033 RepID=A0ABM7Q7F6_9GAMM|nr:MULTISPECIES: transporter [Lysobacter]BCT93205.1 hypothetical protein LYSCAS_22290 [Lysobacter caseinilyticus]BCT96357.1 hypothetical protein LYSHEL_22280 [Lysobacter helvus]